MQQGEKTLIEVAKAKTQASIAAAKRDMAEAHAAGDAERVAEAVGKISKYSSEAEALQYQQPSIRGDVPTPEDSVKNFDRQVQQQRQPQGPHPKAVTWYEGNKDWFEKDPVMTKYAKWLDEELIKRGSSPATDAHYSYIDNELRRVFPDRLKNQEQPRVGPVSRVSAPAPQARVPSQVRLTKSEVSIARKLGLTPEQYAEQKMKDYPDGR